jgi:AraC-like DNA-binding protein
MSAPSLSLRANPRDPILGQVRQFAGRHGVLVEEAMPSLDPVWSALRAAGVDHPGLAYAAWADSLALGGVLTSILTNSPTVEAMLQGLERFHPMLDRDEVTLIRRAGSVTVTLRATDGGPAHPDTVDAAFGMLARGTLRLAGRLPARVVLRRPAPADPGLYRDLLGEVAFGQPSDRCVFDASSLDSPIANADPTLLHLVQPYAERRMAERRTPWVQAVTEVLTGDSRRIPRLAEVARTLAVSSRTLQLRLSEEGQSFAGLAEIVQRERASALLAQSSIPITTIAMRCGFATPAAFSRAFRRWTGTTPTGYRST